jgi:hypothetical protein
MEPTIEEKRKAKDELFIKMAEATKKQKTNGWTRNFIENIEYLAGPDLFQLNNVLAWKPAVCISAGPSLSKNIKQLKQIRKHVVVFCVNTALKSVVSHGIYPDFVTIAEGSDISPMFEGIDVSKFNLIAPPHIHPNNINLPWKRVYCTPHKPSFYGDWIVENGIVKEKMFCDVGASVANFQIVQAWILGCNPIIMLGQDLAFGKNGQVYDKNTKYGDQKIKINRNIATLPAKKDLGGKESVNQTFQVLAWEDLRKKKHSGKRVLSSQSFLLFANYFADMADFNLALPKEKQRLLVNCTEGGCCIPGWAHFPLKVWVKEIRKKKKYFPEFSVNRLLKKLPDEIWKGKKIISALKYCFLLASDEDITDKELHEKDKLFNAFAYKIDSEIELYKLRQEYLTILLYKLKKFNP